MTMHLSELDHESIATVRNAHDTEGARNDLNPALAPMWRGIARDLREFEGDCTSATRITCTTCAGTGGAKQRCAACDGQGIQLAGGRDT